MSRATLTLLISAAAALLISTPAGAQSVTRSTYNELQEIQKLNEAENPTEAQNRLEKLVVDTADKPYDNAIANQYLAHTSIMLDQPKRARKALESALATPDLPPEIRKEMNVFYGTILLGEEEFELARTVLEEWLAATETPRSTQLFSVAYANYKTAHLPRAEELLTRAIDLRSRAPNSWYQLYYRVLFELKKYAAAKGLLHEMLTRDPRSKLTWRMLANHHLQLESSSDALAAMMVAYINELITEPKDLRQLVSMFSYVDIPEKGARLLQQWMDEGILDADADTLQQLGNLWLLARERGPAKVALRNAAALTGNGRTYELLAGVYFEDEDWSEAYSAYSEAMRIGDLEEPMRIALLAGISAFRADQKDDARKALKTAAKSREFRAQAKSLLEKLDQG